MKEGVEIGKPLNILFLMNAFHIGGLETLTLEIVRRLGGDRFSFRLLCLKEKGSLAPEMEALGVPVRSGVLRGTYDPLGPFRLLRAVRGERIDILFVEPGRNALLCGEILGRFARVERRISAVHATGKWGKERMFRPSQIRMLRRMDGVIACAARQRDYLIEHERLHPDNLKVIFNGVDHERFRPAEGAPLPPIEGGPATGERAVGIVASLTPEKGHDVFVDAAAIVAPRFPEARFLIIGEGPERPRIEERIRAKGLEGTVRLLGRRRDLPDLLPRLDLLALSSHPFRETLPISTMEGMACGVPTVNTDVGSVRDLVVDGETGLLVPPGDAPAMAEAFARTLGDPERAAAMGRAGRRRIEERFTLDRAAREYADYFLSVAGAGGT
ncbi:MAG: glycosyltransferase [Candidatus Eisenbacteria bacterium]|nr:glycosyltransferase [Candidatus Eisenbacteria bacterium]